MNFTQWIGSQAAIGQPLNLHAMSRNRPDLLEQTPIGGDARLSALQSLQALA